MIEALARLPEDPDRGFRFVGFGPAERQVSWRELVRETGRRADCLAALGFERGDRLAIALSDGAEFVLSFLGAVRAGVVPAPLPPPPLLNRSFGPYRGSVARILASARARALLTSEDAREAFQPLASEEAGGMPPVLSVETAFRGPAPVLERPLIGPDDLCFLQFTSGSTASPRGVMVTHGNLAANLEALGGPAGFGPKRPEDLIVSWLPLYHDMGLIGIVLGGLYHEVPTVVLSTSSFGRDPRIWLKTIHRYRGTITYAPNFAYALVTRRLREADLSGLDLSCLRVAGCGAEPIQAATLRDFAARLEPAGFRSEALLPSYGMAEATLAVTLHPRGTPPVIDRVDGEALGRGDARPAEEASGRIAELVSCGPVLPGHELAIRSASGETLPDRRVGEITARGPSIARGYWEAEAANTQTFRGGWLHTGDLGYTAGGNLFVCGRTKEVIIVRGANFYPQDIEWALRDLPGIKRGNV
ncbi:MAG: AMP-binding protein, partial [Thermoanaerobaculia bacterium]